jgi:hypothetical protein
MDIAVIAGSQTRRKDNSQNYIEQRVNNESAGPSLHPYHEKYLPETGFMPLNTCAHR